MGLRMLWFEIQIPLALRNAHMHLVWCPNYNQSLKQIVVLKRVVTLYRSGVPLLHYP